jgi:hypothetical protein
MNFLEFVKDKEITSKNKCLLNEAFKEKDMEHALELIDKLLKKHIPGLIPLVGFVDTIIDGKKCTSKQYLVVDKEDYTKSSCFQFNWVNSEDTVNVYSIDFFKDLDLYFSGKAKSDLTINTLGNNVVRFLPIIWNVVNSGKYELSQEQAEKLSSKVFKKVTESIYKTDKVTYKVYEGLKKSVVDDAFMLESDGTSNKELSKQYAQISTEMDGDSELPEQINMSIEQGTQVKMPLNKEYRNAEEEIDQAKKDPEQVFKEMEKYVSLVVKGLQPSLILCGAPGVGKTYRVKKKLKEGNYHENDNLGTVKGKCTARKLYLTLYDYRHKNDIVLIDDADSLVGPKADENCINILKAALDSTTDPEGRLVTYGVAGKILDDEGKEIPKRFYYQGGVIVITNYKAGALDTALRGRSFIQDIKFSNEDVLKIIKDLLPQIEPDILDPKSKIKAYKYLVRLNEEGSDMELSLRTFVLCSKIFKACDGDPDFSNQDAESMIEEQMRLQYARGGHKY